MIIYHVSDEVVKYPEVRISEYTKDFSWGFFLTVRVNSKIKVTI